MNISPIERLLDKTAPQKGDLRIWWVPQVPMKAFRVSVPNVYFAKLLLDTLAQYDLFQFENNVKGDYTNAGGLEVFDPANIDPGEDLDGWADWIFPSQPVTANSPHLWEEDIDVLSMEDIEKLSKDPAILWVER